MRCASRLVVVLLLLACAIVAGCGMAATGAVALARDPDTKVRARYDLSEKAVAVIPFSYQDRRPFESEHGLVLAETVERELLAHVKKVRIVPTVKAKNYLTGIAPAEVDPALLAEMLVADIVITGDIRKLALAQTLSVMEADLRVEVYDAKARALVLREDLSARYPESQYLSPTDLDRPGSVRGAVVSAGRAVARFFYDHKVRTVPEDLHGRERI